MPISLSKNSSKDGDFVDKRNSAAPQEVQYIKRDGVVMAVPINGILRTYDQEVAGVESDLGNFLDRCGSGDLINDENERPEVDVFEIINQAIDKIVDDDADCFNQGWEDDPDFVEVVINLVLGEYSFELADIKRAIKNR